MALKHVHITTRSKPYQLTQSLRHAIKTKLLRPDYARFHVTRSGLAERSAIFAFSVYQEKCLSLKVNTAILEVLSYICPAVGQTEGILTSSVICWQCYTCILTVESLNNVPVVLHKLTVEWQHVYIYDLTMDIYVRHWIMCGNVNNTRKNNWKRREDNVHCIFLEEKAITIHLTSDL